MKITLNNLKKLINEYVELPQDELAAKISAMQPDDLADDDYVDSETGEIHLEKGEPARKSHLHPQNALDHQDRRAKEEAEWQTQMDAEDAEEEAEKAQALSEYEAALKEFASNWGPENLADLDIDPSDAQSIVSDAAEGFFWTYPQWRTWAFLTSTSKIDMKDHVMTLIHEKLLGND